MHRIVSTCRNCGHPIGKVPRGLYVFRENMYDNIRVNSSGFEWLHLVEYDGDRKTIGYSDIPEYLEELQNAEEEFIRLEKEGELTEAQEENYGTRLKLLRTQTNLMKNAIKGPKRDSRMFVLKCWGKRGKCKCTEAEPEASQ